MSAVAHLESQVRHVINAHIEECLPDISTSSDQRLGKSLNKLARAFVSRGVRSPPKALFEKAARFIHTPSELSAFADLLSSDLNLAHVLIHAPTSVLPPAFHHFKNEHDRSVLIAKTALHRIGIPQHEWDAVEHHGQWVDSARELARLVASDAYLDHPEVKALLSESFRRRHHEAYETHPANVSVKEDLHSMDVHYGIWLREPFVQYYRAGSADVRDLKHQGHYAALSEFYSLVRYARSLNLVRDKDLRKLFHTRAGRSFESQGIVRFIEEGMNHYRTHPERTCASDLKLSETEMNRILLNLINRVQRKISRHVQSLGMTTPSLSHLEVKLVALQRVLAPHDTSLSLRESGEPMRGDEPIRYMIKKESKDPVTFLTAGNDSGVCDSTKDRQGFRRAHLACKYGYQEGGIFKTSPRGLRRFGQVRMYAARDENGQSTLIVNSIDLEAEERRNLFLYRKALEYARDFAKKCNFKRLLVGIHADMAIGPFDDHPIFAPLALKRVGNQYVELIDHFPSSQAFSDIFGGGNDLHQTEGRADFYEIDLSRNSHAQ